jgi:hypothetical protein
MDIVGSHINDYVSEHVHVRSTKEPLVQRPAPFKIASPVLPVSDPAKTQGGTTAREPEKPDGQSMEPSAQLAGGMHAVLSLAPDPASVFSQTRSNQIWNLFF